MGYRDFVIALGYKGRMIKQYFVEEASFGGNVHVDFSANQISAGASDMSDWSVELVETGQNTMTGGRIKRLKPFVGDETFLLTWGDGVANIDLNKLLEFHRSHGKLATRLR